MRVWFTDMASQAQTQPTPTPEPLTFDQPVGTLAVVDDARWSAGFTDHSLTALLVWIILLVVLQAAAWPLVQRLFRRFPDRGWAFSRLTTILLAGFLVWFPAAFGITAFRATWCWVAVLAVAAGSWLWQRRAPIANPGPGRDRRAAIAASEVAFWLVFAVFLIFRLINPDSYEPIWGGEKAMEFAHINSILRSAHFPPVDPWYAGGFLNYYYYGSYLVAFLIKLTGIPVEIAFNLALPLFMALLGAGVFSIGQAIGRSLSESRRVQYTSAIAATIFTVFIGNLVDAARTFESLTDDKPRYLWDYWVWGATRIFSDSVTGKYAITEFPYFSALYGDLHAHVLAMPITALVIGLAYSLFLDHRDRETVIETRSDFSRLAKSLATTCLVLGIAMGSLFMTNAWDAPTYGVVCAIGIVAALVGIRPLMQRLFVSGVAIAAIGIVAYIVTFPFNLHYVALFNDIGQVTEKTSLLPVEAHWGIFILIMTVGYATFGFREERKGQVLFDPMLVLPLLGFVLCLRWYGVGRSETLRDTADVATVLVVAAIWLVVTWFGIDRRGDFNVPGHVLRGLTAIAGLIALDGLIIGRPVFAIYTVIGICAGVAWLSAAQRPERFLYGLIATGMLLGALLELVYLVDDLSGGTSYRMNTVFKFYNQLWILFAIAAAGCVARMFDTANRSSVGDAAGADDARLDNRAPLLRRHWARAGLIITAVVTVLGFAYPAQATIPRLDTRFAHPDANLTLDAYAWMEYAEMPFVNADPVTYADDLAAIDWFNEEVSGNPVIAEAAFGTYRCNGSRFSIATGLPAIIGWERHEQQQRDRTLLPQRVRDMRELYETPDIAKKQALIDKYDVEYIVVGQTERVYPQIDGNQCVATDVSAGIGAIGDIVGTDLEIAFSHGTTIVYRVVR